jgi:methanogenic corrinoid protein MtbC1
MSILDAELQKKLIAFVEAESKNKQPKKLKESLVAELSRQLINGNREMTGMVTDRKNEEFDITRSRVIPDILDKIMTEYANRFDEECVSFLKQNGYRPKLTPKYLKGLKARLKKKGLELAIITRYTKSSVIRYFEIRPIEEQGNE